MFLYYPLPPAQCGEVEAEQDIFVDVLKSHACTCTYKMSDCPFSVQVHGSHWEGASLAHCIKKVCKLSLLDAQ